MRINARIDDSLVEKFEYLEQTTKKNVSTIIREAVELYYAKVRGQSADPAKIFEKNQFIASGESDADLSVDYKKLLSQGLGKKHGHR